VQSALWRVRQAAKKDKKMRFTSLMHHIYNPEMLREAFLKLKRDAAAGVDGETWRQYAQDLDKNIQDLSERLARGAYRAKPSRRVYIPKADGRLRPLGVLAVEDKIVQRAATEVLNAIYEVDFVEESFGFRPGRSQHDALDVLYCGQMTKRVNWVLDADIRGFFDAIDREWLMKFIEHRVGDRRVLRLIRKWLNAGVLENGKRVKTESGTVQGGSISPLLANIFLHHVFDLWTRRWSQRLSRGHMIWVRYADDFIVGFEHKEDAERFLRELRERLERFRLELHPEKTRLLEFGPNAAGRRKQAGLGKPETFQFLGFTHICGKCRNNGRFTVLRQTTRTRMQAKLKEVKLELKCRMHEPIPIVGKWLGSVVRGHVSYYGVPMNSPAITAFRFQCCRLWHRALCRRSQKGRVKWERMKKLIALYIPKARICHDYPLYRRGVITRGKSRMR